MSLKSILGGAALALTLALSACGKKDQSSGASPAAAKASAASPLDQPYALKGGSEVDVDALFALFPEKRRPTYERARFDANLGATVVTKLRFADPDPNDGPDGEGGGAFTVDRAELYGVEAQAIERVRSAATPASDAPFEKVFEKVRLYGVKPEKATDTATRIGAIEIDQLRLRRGGLNEKAEENAAEFFNAFSFAGLYFKDIDARADAEKDGALSFKAPDLRFVGAGGGKLEAIIARNVEYELRQAESARDALTKALGGPVGAVLGGPLKGIIAPDRQRVTVSSFEWRAIDLSGLMTYGLKKERPPLSARNLIDLGTLKVLGANTYIDGKKAASAAEATVTAMDFVWLAPSKIRTETKGLMYDFTAYAPATETATIAALKKHGLDKVKGAASFSWDWDADRGGAALKSNFTTDALADFTMDANFSGLELKKMDAAAKSGDGNLFVRAGRLDGFGMRLADKKLLDAVFEVAALEMGGTGAELRASTPGMVRLSGASLALANPRLADYVEAVADFIGEGGALEITARPEAPVPLTALAEAGSQGPEGLPDLINLKVVHKPK